VIKSGLVADAAKLLRDSLASQGWKHIPGNWESGFQLLALEGSSFLPGHRATHRRLLSRQIGALTNVLAK
jgi:hypothetical protein